MLQCVTPATLMREKQSPSYINSSNLWFLIWMPYPECLGFFQFNLIDLFIWHWDITFFFHRLKQVPHLMVFCFCPKQPIPTSFYPHEFKHFLVFEPLIFLLFSPLLPLHFSPMYIFLCILYLHNLNFFWVIF